MTVGEIIYSILDLCKVSSSDDSFITEDHVLFLLKKYRSLLIKKEQEKEKSTTDIASEFEYQQICLQLEAADSRADVPCLGGSYLRTVQKIPKTVEGNLPRVYPLNFYDNIYINFVSRDRMRFVGTNQYLRNIIYASLGPDNHIYLKSDNPQFLYLKQLKVSAMFEDFDEASELLCHEDGSSAACDVMDMDFPIRNYLVPTLIDLVMKEILGAAYRPADQQNSANDELSDLVGFIRRNIKSAFQKQIED